MKYWEIIADNLSKAGFSWGCVSAIHSSGRTIWIVDAHRDEGPLYACTTIDTLPVHVEFTVAVTQDCGEFSLQTP